MSTLPAPRRGSCRLARLREVKKTSPRQRLRLSTPSAWRPLGKGVPPQSQRATAPPPGSGLKRVSSGESFPTITKPPALPSLPTRSPQGELSPFATEGACEDPPRQRLRHAFVSRETGPSTAAPCAAGASIRRSAAKPAHPVYPPGRRWFSASVPPPEDPSARVSKAVRSRHGLGL